MAAQRADITRLLVRVQQTGASNFQDDSSAKGELLYTLDVLNREIEGPAAYLSRVRQAPLLNMCQLMAIEMGLLDAIVKRNGQSVDAHTLANDFGRPKCDNRVRVTRRQKSTRDVSRLEAKAS